MPALVFSAEVRDLALEIAWSLWAELGLSGWTRHHAESAVDLEPLIIATPRLGAWDARLLEESFDWCVLNSRFVSAVRLRNLLKTVDEPTRRAFGDFDATVRMERRVSWPAEGEPLQLRVTSRSSVPDLLRPALQQLRLRAILGEHQHDLARVGTFPHVRQGVEAVNEDFERWSIGALRSWAGLDRADGA
jgi:hypothetical protein